jgi:transcription antitermination factor NusG
MEMSPWDSKGGSMPGIRLPVLEQQGLPATPWFALRVKPQRERMVAILIEHKGYDQMLPTYTARHQWSDRVKNVERPLFPGYVFCRLNLEARAPLLTTAGILYIVGNGRIPAPIPESEMAAIQAVLRSGLPVEPWPYCKVGDGVRLERGPLTGLQGILLQICSQYRIVVSIHLLQRSMAVEVDRSWAVPIRSPHASHSLAG